MEDTVTYVDEPDQFDAHLRDLGRLAELAPDRILPAHGEPERIAGGGYADSLSAGRLTYYEPYEAVHRQNVATVLTAVESAARRSASGG